MSQVTMNISNFTGEISNQHLLPPLKYAIQFPQFSGEEDEAFINRLNKHYVTRANALVHQCQDQIYRSAMKRYSNPQLTGETLLAYEFYNTFQVTLNQEGLLALYEDQYTYTGGANGTSTRIADNWQLDRCRRLAMADLFPPGFHYQAYVEANVIRQIQKQTAEDGPQFYFDNYPQLVHQYFDPKNFYLIPGGMAVFYQEITIAPHVYGTVVFNIPLVTPAALAGEAGHASF